LLRRLNNKSLIQVFTSAEEGLRGEESICGKNKKYHQ